MSNALYDAPVEAGYFKNVVPRTQDVNLPPNCACEISYGIDETNGFLRVRDPFGAFTRARLLGVLARCSGGGVSLDESRGGAGLGLWRVFSIASTVAITVVPGRLTDILVGIVTKDAGKRAPGQRLLAVHLFFNSNTEDALPDEHDVLDDSVAIVA